jgi:hypothetical protein
MRQVFFCSVFFLAASLASFKSAAQETGTPKKQVEWINGMLGLQVGVPVGGMEKAVKNKMGNLGFGAGILAVFNPLTWGKTKRQSPLWIGAEAGYTYYGRFLTEVDISGYKGDYKTSYGVLQLNALIRLRPRQTESINPFMDVLAGGSFYLSTIMENLDVFESSLGIEPISIDDFSSSSFNKGIAVGCNVRKRNGKGGGLTVRVSYNRGNTIKYIVRNSLVYNGRWEYQVGKAPVSYFLVQIGIGD